MRSLLQPTILVLLSFTTTLVSSQSTALLDFTSPNALPACAAQCTPLYSAQSGCVPPAAPGGRTVDQQRTCFCQSSFLQALYVSPNGVCDQACPAAELSQMRNWFTSSCAANQNAVAGGAGGTQPTTTTTPTAATPPPTGTQAGATSTSFPLNKPKDTNQSWIAGHWKWILMLIIVFFAIVAASVGGVWFKRHRQRKAEAAAAAMNTPVAWGPHQHQAFTQGHGAYGPGGAAGGKGKGKAGGGGGGLSRHGKGKRSMKEKMAQFHEPV